MYNTDKYNFSEKDWIELCDRFGNKCLCCGVKGVKLTKDHISPYSISLDGSIENIQPLCEICNKSKDKKDIDYRYTLPTKSHSTKDLPDKIKERLLLQYGHKMNLVYDQHVLEIQRLKEQNESIEKKLSKALEDLTSTKAKLDKARTATIQEVVPKPQFEKLQTKFNNLKLSFDEYQKTSKAKLNTYVDIQSKFDKLRFKHENLIKLSEQQLRKNSGKESKKDTKRKTLIDEKLVEFLKDKSIYGDWIEYKQMVLKKYNE